MGVTAEELAIRTAISTVANTNTLLQKVDSPGRLYAPITKTQLKVDMELSSSDAPIFTGLTIGSLSGILLGTSGEVSAITNNSSNWDSAYSHSLVSSGNPHGVTPIELGLVIGTNVQAQSFILDDLDAIGAPTTDGQFIVATGAGTFAFEAEDTARTSLGLGTGDSPTFTQATLSTPPINDSHAVTKAYVAALSGGGGTFWSNVCAATTEAIDLLSNLENGDTIDGYVLVAGDRVLVKDQVDASENGLYTVEASGPASRSIDADTAEEVEGRKCIVLGGINNVNKLYFCITANIILETTSIQFGELASSGQQGVVELIGQEYETSASYENVFTGHSDISDFWSDETNGYDDDLGTYAQVSGLSGGNFSAELRFTLPETKCSKFRIYAKKTDSNGYYIRGNYYDGSWHQINTVALTTNPAWYEFQFGGFKNVTQVSIECYRQGPTATTIYLYNVEHYTLSSTAQFITTLRAGTPTADYTLVFPDNDGVANNVMISDGSGVLSWTGDVTQWNTAYSWGDHSGLYDATGTAAGLISTHESTYNHDNYNTAYSWGDHSGLYDASGTAAGLLSAFTGTTNIVTLGTIATGIWSAGTIAINKGGTGQITAQAAINALSAVAGATDEHVLTKDTSSGNAIWKAAAGGGGGGTFLSLTDTPSSYDSDDIGKYIRVKSDLTGLEFAEVSSGGFDSYFSANKSDTQNVNSASYAKMQFNTEDYDGSNEYDNSSNYRFTADSDGYYHFDASVSIGSLGAGKVGSIHIYKNGVSIKQESEMPASQSTIIISISCDLYLSATDYIEVYVYHNHGSARTVGGGAKWNYFNGHQFA